MLGDIEACLKKLDAQDLMRDREKWKEFFQNISLKPVSISSALG